MKHTMNTFSSPTHDRGEAQDSGYGNDDSNIHNSKENTNEHNDCKGDLNCPQENCNKATNDLNPTEKDTMESFQDSRRHVIRFCFSLKVFIFQAFFFILDQKCGTLFEQSSKDRWSVDALHTKFGIS